MGVASGLNLGKLLDRKKLLRKIRNLFLYLVPKLDQIRPAQPICFAYITNTFFKFKYSQIMSSWDIFGYFRAIFTCFLTIRDNQVKKE